MTKAYLNAAVASSILDDISRQFMNYHDEINDLRFNEDHHDVDLLMIRYFGVTTEDRQLRLVKAILTALCEETASLYEEEEYELNESLAQKIVRFIIKPIISLSRHLLSLRSKLGDKYERH